MELTVIIPAYNECRTVAKILGAVAGALPDVGKEIIIVDDASTDGTREWLLANFPKGEWSGSKIILDQNENLTLSSDATSAKIAVRTFYHERNKGKGACLQAGLSAATGAVIVFQDADLEYDPQDWVAMYDLIVVRKIADVVYGSRFYGRPHRSLYFHHYMANRLISLLFNILYNQTLTDIEACYKMMTRDVAKSLRLSARDFGIEIEISAKIARWKNLRIYELGISYFGRTYIEGKKIHWWDGVKALWYLLKFRFS